MLDWAGGLNLDSPPAPANPVVTWALTNRLTASGWVAFFSFLWGLGHNLPSGPSSAS